MSITYNLGVPDPNNDPSNDQPDMLQNTIAVSQIWDVDHVTFADSPAGTHAQVTFSSKNTPGAQIDPQSVLYTASGVGSSNAVLKYVNAAQTFPLSIIKAYARFTFTAPNVIAIQQSFNVTGITCASNNSPFVITFTALMATTTYGVFITPNFQSSATLFFGNISQTTSTLTFSASTNSGNVGMVSVMVVEL